VAQMSPRWMDSQFAMTATAYRAACGVMSAGNPTTRLLSVRHARAAGTGTGRLRRVANRADQYTSREYTSFASLNAATLNGRGAFFDTLCDPSFCGAASPATRLMMCSTAGPASLRAWLVRQ
jgi:hypothetical protein